METRNPDYRQEIEYLFDKAAFVTDIGIRLVDCGPGWCESLLAVRQRHMQHGGVIHAGVQGTMADHTAGAAATTVLAPGQFVLTIEFKTNLLRTGQGDELFCRAEVLKAGRSVSVVEADIYALAGRHKTLISKTTATMNILSMDK